MAAGSLYSMMDSPFFLGRKRRCEDDDVFQDAFSSKRRNLSCLPIRSPPLSRPLISVTPAFTQYIVSPGILTPDSIPEDEEYQASDLWSQQPTSASRLHANHENLPDANSDLHKISMPGPNDRGDVDMDATSPKIPQIISPPRIGRARSNDLMSPIQLPTNSRSLLGPLSPTYRSTFGQERVATPVVLTFPSRSPFESSFASAAARQVRQHLHTTLSPMVNADSWTPQIHHPPSPEPETENGFSEDTAMIGMEDSHMMSSSFGALSVHSQDDSQASGLNSSPLRLRSSQISVNSTNSLSRQGLGLNDADGNGISPSFSQAQTGYGNTNDQGLNNQHNRNMSGSGRTARLHMGYKADCEKCVARIPGHYSHIIWS